MLHRPTNMTTSTSSYYGMRAPIMWDVVLRKFILAECNPHDISSGLLVLTAQGVTLQCGMLDDYAVIMEENAVMLEASQQRKFN